MAEIPTTILDQLALIKHYQHKAPVPIVTISLKLGVEVFRASGWPDSISGVIKKVGKDRYVIHVNAGHHEKRRRFTIAHELAHYILHKDDLGDGIAHDSLYRSGLCHSIEEEANALAARILMPWHLLNPCIESGITDIEKLANIFNVSNSSMSIRLGVPFEYSDKNVA